MFRAAVAFVKSSGMKYIKGALQQFLSKGNAKISVGIDHAGTSKEGLSELVEALGTKGEGWVFHNEGPYTFHPKVYLFENATAAECFIGSGNLTKGGLYTNYEAFVHMRLNKQILADRKTLARLQGILDAWNDSNPGLALKLTPALIQKLVDEGILLTESEIAQASRDAQRNLPNGTPHEQRTNSFISKQVQVAPEVASESKRKTEGHGKSQTQGGAVEKEVKSAIQPWRYLLDVVNCVKSMNEIKAGAYMCPNQGRSFSHKRARFLGTYQQKMVPSVHEIDALVTCEPDGKNYQLEWKNNQQSENKLIERAKIMIQKIDPLHVDDVQQTGLKFFLLGAGAQTAFIKDSPGGLRGAKVYFDGIAKTLKANTVTTLAQKLNGRKWSEFGH